MTLPWLTEDFTESPWWWEAAALKPGSDTPLPKAVDVAVIGSGYTGLSAARTLAEAGRNVVVLDAESLGAGASSRNAGFVGRALLGGFSQTVAKEGLADAVNLFRGAEEAYDFTIALIEDLDLKCHLVQRGRLLPVWNQDQYAATERDFELQQRHLKVEGQMLSADQLSQEVKLDGGYGGLLITNTAAVHPSLYNRELLSAAERAGASLC